MAIIRHLLQRNPPGIYRAYPEARQILQPAPIARGTTLQECRGTLVILHPCFNHPLNSTARRRPLGAPSPVIHRAARRRPRKHRQTLQGYMIEHTFAATVSRSQPDGEFPLAVRTSPGRARVPPLAEIRLGWRAEGDPPIVAP